MDRKTKAKIRKAILGSIQKWEKICWHKGVDKKTENCPLCIECDKYTTNDCHINKEFACPVWKISVQKSCIDSPYQNWLVHQENHHHKRGIFKIICPDCKLLAKTELDFLRDVLKKFDAGEIYD